MGVTWMMMSGGGVILAYFLGAHDLGLFRLSDQIDTYLMGAILSPLIPVFYSAFCEAAADREQWQKLFARTVRTVALVAMTLAAVIVLLAHPLEAIIGIKWRGIGAIVVLNAIADGFSYATLPIPTLLRAQGRSRAVAGMRIAMVAGQVVVYSFAAPHGLQAFVSGKVVLEIAMYAISYGVLRATFNVPVLQMVGSQIGPTLAAAVSAVAGLCASSKVASLGVPTAAVGLAVFGILMAAYLFLAQRRFLVAVVSNLTTRASVAAVDDLKR
jgi:hypothetical protein